jgi:hypothetical protein
MEHIAPAPRPTLIPVDADVDVTPSGLAIDDGPDHQVGGDLGAYPPDTVDDGPTQRVRRIEEKHAIGSPHEPDHWFASSRVHHGRGGGG